MSVYWGIEPGDLLALHHHQPNPLCLCGRNIQSVLTTIFKKTEAGLAIKACEQAN